MHVIVSLLIWDMFLTVQYHRGGAVDLENFIRVPSKPCISVGKFAGSTDIGYLSRDRAS